jgi:hypothetical protein
MQRDSKEKHPTYKEEELCLKTTICHAKLNSFRWEQQNGAQQEPHCTRHRSNDVHVDFEWFHIELGFNCESNNVQR